MKLPVVLVIEDEPVIGMAIDDALTEAGFAVELVSNSVQAMALLDGNHELPQALVSDIRLGDDFSGWDVARHARELKPGIGVVYVSGDSGDEWQAHGVPGSVFIQKPFAAAQVVTAVANVVNGVGDGAKTD